MSRYGNYGKNDEPLVSDGDSGFVALNMKLDVDKVPPATLSYALNKRLRRGIAETRPGIVTPRGMNGPLTTDSSGNVLTRLWSAIYGACVYSNPNVPDGTGTSNNEWLVLATDTGIWLTADGWFPVAVALPPGEVITTGSDFAEFEGTLILFRGPGSAVLAWSPGAGQGAAAAATGFQYIPQPDITNEAGEPTGILPIPQAEYGIVFANRLFVPAPNNYGNPGGPGSTVGPLDAILASEILDYTSYDGINDQFVVNSGTNDSLVAILPYSTTALLAFKEQSIWILQNVLGDLSTVNISAVTTALGTCARKSCVQVGADILFLSAAPAGVYRVNQVLQATIQTSAVPVSDPIQPLIDRINWSAASGACAVLWKEYYFLAVPLDGSEVNNVILAYNTVGGADGQGAWESLDTVSVGAIPLGNGQVLAYNTIGNQGGSYTVTGPGTPYSPVLINTTPGTPGTPATWVPAPAPLDYLLWYIQNTNNTYWSGLRVSLDGTGDSNIDGVWLAAMQPPTFQGQPNTVNVLNCGGLLSGQPAAAVWSIGGTSSMPVAGNLCVYVGNLRAAYPGKSLTITIDAVTGAGSSLSNVKIWTIGTSGGSITVTGGPDNSIFAPTGSYTTLFDGASAPFDLQIGMSTLTSLNWWQVETFIIDLVTLAPTLGTPQSPGTPGTITATGGGGSPGTVTVISMVIGATGTPPALPAPTTAMDGFYVTNWNGSRRLFMTDAAAGLVHLMEEGWADQIGNAWSAIQEGLSTRGYRLDDPLGMKAIRNLSVDTGTSNPNLTVSLVTEGVNAVMTLAANAGADRTRYDLWGMAAWNPTNANNDFVAPGRDDYSVVLPMDLGSGVPLNLVQEKLQRWSARARGRWASVNVANASGYCAVRAIELEGIGMQRGPKPSL